MSFVQERGLLINSPVAIDSLNPSGEGSLAGVLNIIKPLLQQAASNDQLFAQVLGEKANTAAIQSVLGQWKIGDFSQLPTIQVLDAGSMNGAFGGYGSSTSNIYLSSILLQSNAPPVDSVLGAGGVLIEEIGHFLDAQVGTDTQGDEGEYFRNSVFGVTPDAAEQSRINAEDDHGFITVNGQQIAIEMSSDYAGNSLGTARNITIGSATTTFRDWVGSTDTNDYYRFTLSNTSNFNLTLNGLSADADVQLLNSSGSVLQDSTNSSSRAESLSRQLNAGTYFIRVYQYSGSTNYNLNLSAITVLPPDYAGNTLSTARNITLGASTTTFQDWVGSTDTNDYYRFTLSNTSNFNLSLNGLSANADVQLLDANGGVIQSSANTGTSAESISRQLNGGTYFLRVLPFSGANTNYNLNLSATAVLPPDYAGNTLSTARNITLGAATTTFQDWVGSADTNDYYRFTLSNTSNFNLSLNGLSADADVQLLNSSGNFIQDSANSGSSTESLSRQLNAGTYFIRVYQYSGSTSYNLNVSATTVLPPDYAGNTLNTARNITLGTATATFQDWVGSADTNDYYRFTLSNTSNFNLSLNGLSANADVQLLDANGVLIQSSSNSGTTAESIIRQINAGTYFIRVLPFSGANTNYRLNVYATNASVTPGDWYSQNLRDAGIASLARALAADGNLSRNDILAIFRNAQDGSLIDSNEQADLRTIVSNSTRFSIGDSVRYLSQQVVNGLTTNMSANSFESNLVGRWFLGTVAPTAVFNNINLTYTQVQGNLFGSSGQARIGDIDQGSLGDCAFLAALGSTFRQQLDDSGNQTSAVINSMIEDNGVDSVTGIRSYTMRFYANSVAQYVTVDNRLATYNGQIFGARTTNALWVPLVERAYAQWREWREGRPGYNLIGNGDNITRPLEFVTGRAASYTTISSISFNQLQTALNNDRAVMTGRFSNNETNTQYIVDRHAYSVTSAYVNGRGEQRVVVRNPWGLDGLTASGNAGDGFIDLSFSEFRNSMFGVSIA